MLQVAAESQGGALDHHEEEGEALEVQGICGSEAVHGRAGETGAASLKDDGCACWHAAFGSWKRGDCDMETKKETL